jgi:hypothetical protein
MYIGYTKLFFGIGIVILSIWGLYAITTDRLRINIGNEKFLKFPQPAFCFFKTIKYEWNFLACC